MAIHTCNGLSQEFAPIQDQTILPPGRTGYDHVFAQDWFKASTWVAPVAVNDNAVIAKSKVQLMAQLSMAAKVQEVMTKYAIAYDENGAPKMSFLAARELGLL